MTKAEKIRELKRDDPSLTSTAIADRLDTSPGYVREVWTETAPEPDDGDDRDLGDDQHDADAGGVDLGDLRDDANDAGGANVDPEGPLADLIISDEWDEYECSECGGEVEYLQETCGSCDHDLAWWAEP